VREHFEEYDYSELYNELSLDTHNVTESEYEVRPGDRAPGMEGRGL